MCPQKCLVMQGGVQHFNESGHVADKSFSCYLVSVREEGTDEVLLLQWCRTKKYIH